MKMLFTLALLTSVFSVHASLLPKFDVKCAENYWNDPQQAQLENIKDVLETREITEADIKAGIATKEHLGANYAEKTYKIGAMKVVAQVFVENLSLRITLPDGTYIFSGNEGKRTQLGAFINDDFSHHSIHCSMVKK
ncbi:MAG: hypothetical protein ACOYL6_18125 [Bacteriovoracaceae bacterium]